MNRATIESPFLCVKIFVYSVRTELSEVLSAKWFDRLTMNGAISSLLYYQHFPPKLFLSKHKISKKLYQLVVFIDIYFLAYNVHFRL